MPLNIALVDDDESVSRSITRLLRLSDMNPTAFRSTEAFLRDPNRTTFDCLILDIYFEGGPSGLELKMRLNAEGNQTPVIFFSAHDDAETRAETVRVGCHAFLRKGDGIKLLLSALREIEQHRRSED
jgi:FixJ family two-component response regulator